MTKEIQYTREFFEKLEEMIDKRPHLCRECGARDGERGHYKDGRRKKFPRIVRLCLIDPKGPPNDARNVAMFCTRCRKPNQVWRTPRRLKPSELPQMDFSDKVVELRCKKSAAEESQEEIVAAPAA